MEPFTKSFCYAELSHAFGNLTIPLTYQTYDPNYPIVQEISGSLALSITTLACDLYGRDLDDQTATILRITLPIIMGFGTYYLAATDKSSLKALATDYFLRRGVVHLSSSLFYHLYSGTYYKIQKYIAERQGKIDQCNDEKKKQKLEEKLTEFQQFPKFFNQATTIYSQCIPTCPTPKQFPVISEKAKQVPFIGITFCSNMLISKIPKSAALAGIKQAAQSILAYTGAFYFVNYIKTIPELPTCFTSEPPLKFSWAVIGYDAISKGLLAFVFTSPYSPLNKKNTN